MLSIDVFSAKLAPAFQKPADAIIAMSRVWLLQRKRLCLAQSASATAPSNSLTQNKSQELSDASLSASPGR